MKVVVKVVMKVWWSRDEDVMKVWRRCDEGLMKVWWRCNEGCGESSGEGNWFDDRQTDRQTNWLTDIGGCRVAFATENDATS